MGTAVSDAAGVLWDSPVCNSMANRSHCTRLTTLPLEVLTADREHGVPVVA